MHMKTLQWQSARKRRATRKRTWAQTEYSETDLWKIFHQSSGRQLDEVVHTAVANRFWPIVTTVLETRTITDTQRTWVVEEALRHADKTHLTSILPHCSDGQLDAVLTEAVTRGLWNSVDKLLSRNPSDERRQWALNQAIQHADDACMKCLLQKHSSKFGTDQLPILFTQAVTKGLWGSLINLQKVMNLTPEQRKRGLSEACKRATGFELTCIIQTFGDTDNLWSVIPELIRRQELFILSSGRLDQLMPNFTETQKTWIVVETSKEAEETNLTSLLEHCPDGALDTVMKELLQRRFWRAVSNLLDDKAERIGLDVRKLAVEEATKDAGDDEYKLIIRHKTSDQLDLVLTSAVERRLWGVVVYLLGCGDKTDPGTEKTEILQWLKTEKIQSAFTAVSNGANCEMILYMLRNNPFDSINLDGVLREVVMRDIWEAVVDILMSEACSEEMRKWAVEKAVHYTGDASVHAMKSIFRRCADDQLGFVLKAAVKRKMWKCTYVLLIREASKPHRRWVLEEASKDADEAWLFEMINFCADDQLDSMLTTVVERKLWKCVTHLLTREVSSTKKLWTLEEACQHAPEDVLINIIDQHTVSECYDSALVATLRRSCFGAVNVLLSSLSDEQQIRSAVEKAAGRLTQEERDTAVIRAVSREAWSIVCLVLEQSDVSDDTKTTVINDICSLSAQDVEDSVFLAVIQHCDSSQLVTVLREAVIRNLISTARDILTRIGQHGDPLAVNDDDETILQVVMLTRDCCQLVAECIKLGVSTHRPLITDSAFYAYSYAFFLFANLGNLNTISSHLARAVSLNDKKLVMMLWESGSCSTQELHSVIESGADPNTSDARQRGITRYLMTVASNPRSLKSACRLVISHHLGVGCRRQENVKQLPLPETLRNYVLFAELLDPEPDATVQQGERPGTVDQAGVARTNDAETRIPSILTLLQLETPERRQSFVASSINADLDYDTSESSCDSDDDPSYGYVDDDSYHGHVDDDRNFRLVDSYSDFF